MSHKPNSGLIVGPEILALLAAAPETTFITTERQLLDLVMGDPDADEFEVTYDIPHKGRIVEAKLTRVKEGFAVWFPEKIRQRSPNALVVAEDGRGSDHPRFAERFEMEYDDYRKRVIEWLSGQPLIVVALFVGPDDGGVPVLAVMPKNAAFFAYGMALLQGFVPLGEDSPPFTPKGLLLLAPNFRHELFDGEQVVVHHRGADLYTIISDNLYPGPSGKKGAGYAMLVHFLEQIGGIAAHCSVVTITDPTGRKLNWMHGGPSGAGKSENGRKTPLDAFDRFILGRHRQSSRTLTFQFRSPLQVKQLVDDIGIIHPDRQTLPLRIVIQDGEREGYFLRVETICGPEDEAEYQQQVRHARRPLLFLNLDGQPGEPIELWRHTDGCKNPRVFTPKFEFFGADSDAVAVDVQSWGFRQPPCSMEAPSYGIGGLCHVLPWQVAWIWNLLAPRGHANPSIVGNGALESEGVGSYRAFNPGREVDQANLLLVLMQRATNTQHLLIPNQNIGRWEVGYGSQWFVREFVTRKAAGPAFYPSEIEPAHLNLFGYELVSASLDGQSVDPELLHPVKQYGMNAYNRGKESFMGFARPILQRFATHPDIHPTGRKILQWALKGGRIREFGHPGPTPHSA